MTSDDLSLPAAGALADLPRTGRSDAVLKLLALAGDLERLGYPYEAYQLREGATRLLHDLPGAG
ncbi:MAG: hypothetical protein ACYDAB_00375 [bacterium]